MDPLVTLFDEQINLETAGLVDLCMQFPTVEQSGEEIVNGMLLVIKAQQCRDNLINAKELYVNTQAAVLNIAC